MISFNKPYFTEKEFKNVNSSLESRLVSGDQRYTKKCHKFIEETFMTSKALLTTSCSMSLDMASILLDLKEGDEVIMPSFNFVSSGNSVLAKGARPVFAEICKDTLNIDPIDIEKKIGKKTKAIFPVHYAGVSCDMDKIMDIAKVHNLKVVEDAAQGVNAKYKDKYLGTIGDIGTYSFHETKNYVSGEGGAILINYDEDLAKRAEIIREKGTNRSQFFRGEIDKYTWVDSGSSYLMSDMLAAILYAQFEKLDEIQEKRKAIYEKYYNSLKELENNGKLILPTIPNYCSSNYHIFYILLPSEEHRDSLMNYLKMNKIGAVFHYIPLHTSPMGRMLGYQLGDLPITESISSRLLRLPIFPELSNDNIDCIIEKIYTWISKWDI